MGGDAALRDTVARVRRALPCLNTRSTEFVSSVHYKSQKFVASTAGLPGSDVHHDKPIAADFKCEVCHTSPGG